MAKKKHTGSRDMEQTQQSLIPEYGMRRYGQDEAKNVRALLPEFLPAIDAITRAQKCSRSEVVIRALRHYFSEAEIREFLGEIGFDE